MSHVVSGLASNTTVELFIVSQYRSRNDIYVVLCGRMTPGQKTIVWRQAEMDAYLYMYMDIDLLTWFFKESDHRRYSAVSPLGECPNPVIVLQEDVKYIGRLEFGIQDSKNILFLQQS